MLEIAARTPSATSSHNVGDRQARERNEFALRHKDDARHREDKHKRDRDQRVNRAVDHRILDEEQNDRRIQDDQAPRACAKGVSFVLNSATFPEPHAAKCTQAA
jgi:hypothetical protein